MCRKRSPVREKKDLGLEVRLWGTPAGNQKVGEMKYYSFSPYSSCITGSGSVLCFMLPSYDSILSHSCGYMICLSLSCQGRGNGFSLLISFLFIAPLDPAHTTGNSPIINPLHLMNE